MARPMTKEKILSILNEHKGSYCSGEFLAKEIGVTRAAVWKAVNALRDSGYRIEGSTKLGYTLSPSTDILDEKEILKALTGNASDFYKVTTLAITESTNNDVKALAVDGAPEGLVYVAKEQTSGKGRKGRSFYSPADTGLYLSILLRPNLSFKDSVLITTAASVAAVRACEKINKASDIKIKWVNDLFINGKKFVGILTEGSISIETGRLEYAVMGIGFNLCRPIGGWPENISGIAGSLFEDNMPLGTRNALTSAFLNEFLPIYKALPDVSYLDEYRKRHLATGKIVRVISGETTRNALVTGVNDKCELIVIFDGETEETVLNSGEISIKL